MFRSLVLALAFIFTTIRAEATLWSVYAGSDGGFGTTDATGTAARFNSPFGVAVDPQIGEAYVTDAANRTIRKVTPAGVVTTLAGLAGASGPAVDATGSAARLRSPGAIAFLPAATAAAFGVPVGSFVFGDEGKIRVVTPAGVVTTLAGGASGGVDGTGAQAGFSSGISAVAVDDAISTVYIADFTRRVRKMTPGGVVTTLAGSATQSGYVDDVGAAARFSNTLTGLVVLPGGDLLVSDAGNQRFRQVTRQGVVTTYATTPVNAPPVAYGMVADASGNVYCVFFNGVAKIDAASGHAISTVAGSGGGVYADGQGTAASFTQPTGLTFNSDGDLLLVADKDNHAIRKVTLAGVVTTLAGKGLVRGSADGTGTAAAFSDPNGLGVDGSGLVFVADSSNSTVRQIAAGGVVTTWAGMAGNFGSGDGTGSAAQFSFPLGLAAQANGTLYVTDSDSGSGRVRVLTPLAEVSTLPPMLNSATAVAVAPAGGALAVVDRNNHLILAISPGGVVSPVAGMSGVSGADDGTGTAATFNTPSGVAVDAAGTIYVADTGNQKIRKITMPGGVVTTLAGGSFGLTDGVGTAAAFANPRGVAVDAAGNVFVADANNHAIRKVTPIGRVITLGGNGSEGNAMGEGRAAAFKSPLNIAVAPDGTLYVSDANQRIVRGVDNSTEPPLLTAPLANSVTNTTVTVTYELTEPALVGSVTVKFTPPSGSPLTLTLTAGYAMEGGHTFTFDPANPLTSAPAAIGAISGGSSVPDATYTVTLSTQDARLNPVASAMVAGVKIDTTTLPPTLAGPAANAAVGQLITLRLTLPETPSSVAVSFGNAATLTLDPAQFTAGVQKTVTFDPADPVATSSGGVITSGAPIVDGVYAVTLAYADSLLNPAATVTNSGVRVDTVVPTITPPANGFTGLRFVGTVPNFTGQVTTSDESTVTVTQSPPAGVVTNYTGQRFTVTLTATDAAGNVTTYEVEDVDARPANPLHEVLFTAGTRTVPGGLAPGAGTFPGLPGDARLASFGPPAVDEEGSVAFLAKWTSATGPLKKGAGIFLKTATAQRCLAVQGGASPVSGATYKTLLDPVISRGKVAFLATLSGVPRGQESAIVSDAPTGTLAVVAQTGTDAFLGGATFKKFTGVQVFGSIVGFLAQVTGGTAPDKISAANDVGLWVKNATDDLFCSLRKGDPIDPNSGDSRKIKTLVSFAVGAGSPGQGRGWLSDPYDVVLPALVILDDKAKTQAVIGGTSGNPLLLSLGGSTTIGQPALTGTTFQSYSFPTYANSYATAFLGTLTTGAGTPAVTKANGRGIFSAPDVSLANFTYTAVARLTDPVTDSNGATGTFSVLKDPVLALDTGLAFPATLKGTAIQGAAATTLWWQPPADALKLLAQGGHVAGSGPQGLGVPGVGANAEYQTFSSLAIASTRGPLFTATLAAGRGGVLKAQSSGVWAVDFSGKLGQLFRSGVTKLAVDNDPDHDKTLKSFTILTAVPGSVGVTRSFNDAGDVTWLATFTDGTTAIVKTVVP